MGEGSKALKKYLILEGLHDERERRENGELK